MPPVLLPRLPLSLLLSAIAPLLLSPGAIAQNIPNDLPEEDLPDIEQITPDLPPDPFEDAPEEIPETPAPTLELPAEPVAPIEPEVPAVSFLVEDITVTGNTVLEDEIQALVAEYEGREVTFDELLELRSRITQLYLDSGYITSGAFLPTGQTLTDGTVDIQIVEGSVEDIQVGGLRHLQRSYVRSRLRLGTETPLDQDKLLESLQLLQLDPFIRQINANLTAGTAPGRNILIVEVDEPSPFSASIGGDNYRPPSIGSGQISFGVGYSNLIGIGDRLFAEYGFTDGLDIFDVGASVPLNPRDGTLSFRFNSSESEIIDEEFEELEIQSETRTYGLSFRQPVVRSPETEFALGIGIDLRRRQTFILDDIPFSFSEGPEEGQSNVTVIRLFQDWVDRSATRVLAARSQFSFGIDAFNATVNDSGTDGRFFTWIGQFQWVQQIGSRNLLITRLSTQLTPDSLLSLEQFSIGGVDTVRGYAQNQLVADNGVLGAVELRLPVTRNPQRLQLIPFFEIGTVWNNRTPDPEESTLAGIGLGLRAEVLPNLFARLDYGIPLINVDNDSDSLQEDGFYFSLRYQPF
ncbi:MAG: ShlB/FhaC/HecB family hemolysin secretion/activation protein [Synechococcales bacterium]|nr:ShlB/FhaC/HecB family hemolysin secretion/activation protein [Synechococcales bacterium]